MLAHPVVKKKALTVSEVQTIVHRFGWPGVPPSDLQTVLLIVLGFAGFFWWNDLSVIRVEDLLVKDSHMMTVHLKKCKNDQFHKGQHVNIARTGSESCPVTLTERFLLRAGISEGPLFREIKGHDSCETVSHRALKYSLARSRVLKMFSDIGLNSQEYGLHSLHSGGASAASQKGVSDRLISAHGGWRSESSCNGYIRDNQKTLLSVSKALEL